MDNYSDIDLEYRKRILIKKAVAQYEWIKTLPPEVRNHSVNYDVEVPQGDD